MMVLWNKSLQSDWSESCDKDELMSSSVLKWENKHFEIRFDALTVWWMRTLSLYILWCCQQGRFLLHVDCVGVEGSGATREPPQVASSFSISEEWPHGIGVKSTWHLACWLVRSALYRLVRSGVYCAIVAMTTSITKQGEVRRVALSCRYQLLTAWRQNESIHLIQKKEETRWRKTLTG